MFISPVTISNRIPPTSISSVARSNACAGDFTGGQANSRGITDHSLASTTGTRTSPRPTCRPWVSRKSHDGRVGQSIGGQVQEPDVTGDRLTRSVGDVVEQAGDDHQRQRGEQGDAEHGGEPRPA